MQRIKTSLPHLSSRDTAIGATVCRSWNAFFSDNWVVLISQLTGITIDTITRFDQDVKQNPLLENINYHPFLYQRLLQYKQKEESLPLAVKTYFCQVENHYLLLACCLDNIAFAEYVLSSDEIIYWLYAAIYAGSNNIVRFLLDERYSPDFTSKENEGSLARQDVDWNLVAAEANNIPLVKYILRNNKGTSDEFFEKCPIRGAPGLHFRERDEDVLFEGRSSVKKFRKSVQDKLNTAGYAPALIESEKQAQKLFKLEDKDYRFYFKAYLKKSYKHSPRTCMRLMVNHLSQTHTAHTRPLLISALAEIIKSVDSFEEYLTSGSRYYYTCFEVQEIMANWRLFMKTLQKDSENELLQQGKSIEEFFASKEKTLLNSYKESPMRLLPIKNLLNLIDDLFSSKEKRRALIQKIEWLMNSKSIDFAAAHDKVIDDELRRNGFTLDRTAKNNLPYGGLDSIVQVATAIYATPEVRREMWEDAARLARASATPELDFENQFRRIVNDKLAKTDYSLEEIKANPAARAIFEKSKGLSIVLKDADEPSTRPEKKF